MIKINSLLENSIIDIIKNYSSFFLNKENVNGIALGYKFINGIDTKEPTLHVLVEKKVPKTTLYPNHIIPKSFFGIKTDVIEIGTLSTTSINDNNSLISYYSFNHLIIKALNSRMRPIQPGCSICPFKSGSGTLGCIVFDNKDNTPYILSNNHVLANLGISKKGTYIYQPNFFTFLKFKNNIAKLTSYIHLHPITSQKDVTTYNTMDVAIAKINSTVKYNKEIFLAGPINGTSQPIINEAIYKVGARTGYTVGKITSLNATLLVKSHSNQLYRYKNQIICSKITNAGDSGSLVFNKAKNAIGLVMSGGENSTIITPITNILNIFNLHF